MTYFGTAIDYSDRTVDGCLVSYCQPKGVCTKLIPHEMVVTGLAWCKKWRFPTEPENFDPGSNIGLIFVFCNVLVTDCRVSCLIFKQLLQLLSIRWQFWGVKQGCLEYSLIAKTGQSKFYNERLLFCEIYQRLWYRLSGTVCVCVCVCVCVWFSSSGYKIAL